MIKKNLRDIYINSIDNEYKFLDIIKKYFNDDSIKKTNYKYDVYDYTSNKYKIELKTRYNISYNTYDFLIIPETKILNYDNNFKYIFVFYFDKDKELYFYEYDLHDYKTKKLYIINNHLSRTDRNKKEYNNYLFISNTLLKRILI